MAREDLDFASDASAAIERTIPRGAWLVLVVVLLLIASLGIWAAFAQVDQITRGQGRVIPSRQTQLVESLESGIVADILVAEGDLVEKGQLLIKIDDTSSTSRLGELRHKKAGLTAELDRLNAQADNADTFDIPPNATEEEIPFYRNQLAVFLADRRNLDEQLLVRRQQLLQRKQSLLEAEATAKKTEESLTLSEKELELNRRLFDRKAIPEIELLRIERNVAGLRGDLAIWNTTRDRLVAAIEEAKTQIEADRTAFLADVRRRISEASGELALVNQALFEARDKVGRTELRSPVAGIVNRLSVSSLGEVVQSGVSIVEIVPVDDKLLIEARISPQDIAFIRPGLPAKVRISAYDYTKFGTLSGVVDRIGADTLTNENRETFYRIIVNTEADTTQFGRSIKIIPGMTAIVEIKTGSRSILEYLLKPVLKIRDRAFRDPR